MPSNTEKQRRRAIVQELRRKEFEEASARKPVSDRDLKELIEHLELTLFDRGDRKILSKCDHTLKRSREFLNERGVADIEQICEWFGEYGGFCDCEVAYNVADYWYERIKNS